jgi:hypothetical protein
MWPPASYYYFCVREEHKLSLFKNEGLRKMFGPSREKVTAEWRELHNVKLHDMYCSPNIIWVMCRHVACVDEK